MYDVLVGCGDHTLKEISLLPDPCPLPNAEKKRSLNEKERLIYAPLSGVGGVVYDKVKKYLKLFLTCLLLRSLQKIGTQENECDYCVQ